MPFLIFSPATPPADKTWHGDSLETPDSADYAVNNTAPSVADTVRTAEVVARHDDTLEEGRALTFRLPLNTSSLEITVLGWPETAPPAARTVGFKVYAKNLTPGGAIPAAWFTTSAALADVSIATATRNIVEQVYTIAYSAFATALVPGVEYHIQITRPAPQGGTELVGDWDLRSYKVRGV